MNQYYSNNCISTWDMESYSETNSATENMSHTHDEIISNDSYSIADTAEYYDLEPTVKVESYEVVIPRVTGRSAGKVAKYDPNSPNINPASRPGRKPRQADDQLSQTELERRNRRRARNREAAQRQRERRLTKVDGLEREVQNLTNDNSNLLSENEQLKKELENLKFQLSLQNAKVKSKPLNVLNNARPVMQPITIPTAPIQSLDIPNELFTPSGTFVLKTPAELKMMNTFDFPQIDPCDIVRAERSESFSEVLCQL